jgi:hypothetical protein
MFSVLKLHLAVRKRIFLKVYPLVPHQQQYPLIIVSLPDTVKRSSQKLSVAAIMVMVLGPMYGIAFQEVIHVLCCSVSSITAPV